MRAWENDTVWENKRTVWCEVPSQRTQNAQESLGAAQKTASQEEAQQGGEGDEMQPGGQRRRANASGPAERPQDERGNPEPHVTKDASDAEAAAPAEPRGPEHKERAQDQRGNLLPHVTKEASVSEVTPPDWGGEEEESSPEGQDKAGTVDAQWPWGPAGRPSDQEAGQMRPSEPTGGPPSHNSGPTDTPCEPAGEPPAQPRRPDDDGKGERPTVTLVPNLSWQVQHVQEHMARRRRDRAAT